MRRRNRTASGLVERIRGLYPAPGFCDEELIFYKVSQLARRHPTLRITPTMTKRSR